MFEIIFFTLKYFLLQNIALTKEHFIINNGNRFEH